MPEGRVTGARGGFFDVMDGHETRRCRARGVFKKRGVTILVGDYVSYEPVGMTEGVITEVFLRQSQLIRPPIANVNQVLLVFSLVTPDFNGYLLDRLLVAVQVAGIAPIIVLSKADLASEEQRKHIQSIYTQIGYEVVFVATKLDIGVEKVRQLLHGHITVFAGPSGAGKSTLANAIAPKLDLKMGEVSDKLGTGKHTTRHVELHPLDEQTWVADAPGFSQMDVTVSSRDLRGYFSEIKIRQAQCAYRDCLHMDEEDCAVKRDVLEGKIDKSRYGSYQMIFQEIREREENQY